MVKERICLSGFCNKYFIRTAKLLRLEKVAGETVTIVKKKKCPELQDFFERKINR